MLIPSALSLSLSLPLFQSKLEFNLRMQEFIELARVRTSTSLCEAIAYHRKHLLPLYVNASSSASSFSVPDSAGKVTASASQPVASTSTKKEEGLGTIDEQEEKLAQETMRQEIERAFGLLACGPGGWAYEVSEKSSRVKSLHFETKSTHVEPLCLSLRRISTTLIDGRNYVLLSVP